MRAGFDRHVAGVGNEIDVSRRQPAMDEAHCRSRRGKLHVGRQRLLKRGSELGNMSNQLPAAIGRLKERGRGCGNLRGCLRPIPQARSMRRNASHCDDLAAMPLVLRDTLRA